jgi:hypothetical protein
MLYPSGPGGCSHVTRDVDFSELSTGACGPRSRPVRTACGGIEKDKQTSPVAQQLSVS